MVIDRHQARAAGPNHSNGGPFANAHFRQAMREMLAAIHAMHGTLLAHFQKLQRDHLGQLWLLGEYETETQYHSHCIPPQASGKGSNRAVQRVFHESRIAD